MATQLLVLPGDGIGPEIIAQAIKIIDIIKKQQPSLNYEYGLLGGVASEREGSPFPESTRKQCDRSDAILLGAVGHPQYDNLERALRPERGLLAIRKYLGLFANLRPIHLFPQLNAISPLKIDKVINLDCLIVRELTGDIYFGEPRGISLNNTGEKEGFNTMRYSKKEIERIAHVSFQSAQKRRKKLCSVDKANVLETTELWRQVFTDVHKNYPDVMLSHMYVDNAAMQLVKEPGQFDVVATGNLFGDILSDLAGALIGSLGLLPSASLNQHRKGLYEPAHGSAPDIAGQDKANPLATLLSLAMLFRYSLQEEQWAQTLEEAIASVLEEGYRTADIAETGSHLVGCETMGDSIAHAFAKRMG